MPITDIRCHRLVAALHTPFVTSLRRTSTLETVVVEVVDSDGHRGFGEAPQVWQVTGESLAGAEACLGGPLAETVRSTDPDDLTDTLRRVAHAVEGNHGAKAAMDVALHDLLARRRGVSLPRLLGTTTHRVTTDVTVSAGDIDAVAETARKRRADGFDVLKTKVGTDAATDVARVRAVRDAVGPDVRLRVDANQGWTPRQAVTVIRALEDAGVGLEFVEQPVPRHDLDGMARVTAAVDTPIMADESVFSLRDLTEVITRGAADLVNVKLAKCGGLAPARAILSLAAEHGIGTIVGSMMEGPIGVGAAASLVAAFPTTYASDLDAAWWAAAPPVVGGLVYDGSVLVLPDVPGLGIEGLA